MFPARFSRSPVSLLALSFAGLLACKSETSADAYVDKAAQDICEAVIACDCQYPNGALLEHCLGQLTVNFDAAVQINVVEGLSFDGDCADQTLSTLKERGCGVDAFDPDAECEAPCKVWYGPVGKGGTCATVNGFDNCKQGLVCGGDGVCVAPCAEPKVPAIGEVCGQLLGCVEGAYCDLGELNPVCQALPIAGEACTSGESLCAEGLFCDASEPGKQVCTAPPGLGAECIEFTCAEGLICDTTTMPNTCAALPKLGEACPVGACQAPSVCNAKNVCAAPPPQICGAYGGLPLEDCGPAEFTCNNGACIAADLACDGMAQCNDASDEAPFNGMCAAACAGDEFTCEDGNCIDILSVCDGLPDCADESDEAPLNPLCP